MPEWDATHPGALWDDKIHEYGHHLQLMKLEFEYGDHYDAADQFMMRVGFRSMLSIFSDHMSQSYEVEASTLGQDYIRSVFPVLNNYRVYNSSLFITSH